MKILIASLTFCAAIILLDSCGSSFYTKRELRDQVVPEILKNRTWTLKQISIERDTAFHESYRSYDANTCPFTFQFENKGKLITDFKAKKLYGSYLIEGDKFKYFHFGWIMKVVWIGNPECEITPTQLSYVFHGSFQFKIEGETLILKNKRGDKFILTANS